MLAIPAPFPPFIGPSPCPSRTRVRTHMRMQARIHARIHYMANVSVVLHVFDFILHMFQLATLILVTKIAKILKIIRTGAEEKSLDESVLYKSIF